jgi:hypothetical protein
MAIMLEREFALFFFFSDTRCFRARLRGRPTGSAALLGCNLSCLWR